MSGTYVISRVMDPIFSVTVGVAAAAVRINREEKGKGRTTQDTIDSLKRRAAMLFEEVPEPQKAAVKKS